MSKPLLQKIKSKKALLLDMNNTFMLQADRFGKAEDFAIYYRQLKGSLPANYVNRVIREAFAYLAKRYENKEYFEKFPSVEVALRASLRQELPQFEIENLVNTFAHHELGQVSDQYTLALSKLSENFTLALVSDIWAPKQKWTELLQAQQIDSLFAACYFSSDYQIVKPSAKPFETVLKELNLKNAEALMVGDSPNRDLEGALAANIDCVLVGGKKDTRAIACFDSLLSFVSLCITES